MALGKQGKMKKRNEMVFFSIYKKEMVHTMTCWL